MQRYISRFYSGRLALLIYHFNKRLISMDVFIGLEGYTLPSQYVLKELAILFPNEEYDHFLFMKPDNFRLTEKDYKTVRYITNDLNNISYDDGDVPYIQIGSILEKINQYKIYTYGVLAKNILQKYLPTTLIIDIQEDMKFKLQEELPDPKCFRLHNYKYRYCAKAKAIAIKNFLLENEL